MEGSGANPPGSGFLQHLRALLPASRTGQFANSVFPSSAVWIIWVLRSQQVAAVASPTLSSLYQSEITGTNKWKCLSTQPFRPGEETGWQCTEQHAKSDT